MCTKFQLVKWCSVIGLTGMLHAGVFLFYVPQKNIESEPSSANELSEEVVDLTFLIENSSSSNETEAILEPEVSEDIPDLSAKNEEEPPDELEKELEVADAEAILEAQQEADRLKKEQEIIEQQILEEKRIEELAKQAEQERLLALENERLEKLKEEKERLEKERLEKQRVEQEKLAEQKKIAEQKKLAEQKRKEAELRKKQEIARKEAARKKLEADQRAKKAAAEKARLAAQKREQQRKAALATTVHTKASTTKSIYPVYPRSLERKKIEGRVGVSVVISTSGKVTSARVSKSSGYADFDKNAITAAKKWRFKPAKNGLGQAISSTKTLYFNYKKDN